MGAVRWFGWFLAGLVVTVLALSVVTAAVIAVLGADIALARSVANIDLVVGIAAGVVLAQVKAYRRRREDRAGEEGP
jgi:high-affinity Fe2+/Pb2+ permease